MMNVAGLAKGKMTFLEIIKAQMWLRFFINYGELKFKHDPLFHKKNSDP